MLTKDHLEQIEILRRIAEQAKVDTGGPSPLLMDPESVLDLLEVIRRQREALERVSDTAFQWSLSEVASIAACGAHVKTLVDGLMSLDHKEKWP